MQTVGTIQNTMKITESLIGTAYFEKPGLKIIRFVTEHKQEVKFDRLCFIKVNEHGGPDSALKPSLIVPEATHYHDENKHDDRTVLWQSANEWNKDKSGLEWLFPLIDKNQDGQIDAIEYTLLQSYKKEKGAYWKNIIRKELN